MKTSGVLLAAAVACTATENTWTVTRSRKHLLDMSGGWAGGISGLSTSIFAEFDDDKLKLIYDVQDSSVQLNAYDVCNEDVFNQEVVEVFITGDEAEVAKAKPESYYEVCRGSCRGIANSRVSCFC